MNEIYILDFPCLTYNCDKPFYKLDPLPDSIIAEAIVFAYKNNDRNSFAIAISLNSELNNITRYKTIERLKNLVCLVYLCFSQENLLKSSEMSIEKVVKNNLSTKYCFPGVSFGKSPEFDLPLKLSKYTKLISRLNPKDREKFWQSLQTFCYACQISSLPNPQYKYTLFLTLYLASINQLANKPNALHNPKGIINCSVCDCSDKNFFHKTTHIDEIEKIIRELIPESYADEKVELVRKLFHPVRSNFVHGGKLSGNEDIGGFLELLGKDPGLMEDYVNTMNLNRSLLEQFLVKNFIFEKE